MVLITGGAGYIGSHLAFRLLLEGYKVIVYDNLSNSTLRNLRAIFTSLNCKGSLFFLKGDIRDENLLGKVFKNYKIRYVIHLAALKSVNDSDIKRGEYLDVNILGTQVVFDLALKYSTHTLIFASSSTVYSPLPIGEYEETRYITGFTSTYGLTKFRGEELLETVKRKDPSINTVCLRYFNPVGLHQSGLLIEENLTTDNLFANIVKHLKNGTTLSIYGNKYLTYDGTCIRDYIHIEDVVDIHIKIIEELSFQVETSVYNVGTDIGYTVKEVVDEFNRHLLVPLKFKYEPRRATDAVKTVSVSNKIREHFNWEPQRNLSDMVRSSLPKEWFYNPD